MPTPSTTSRLPMELVDIANGSAVLRVEEMSVLVFAGLGDAVGLMFSLVLVAILSVPRLGIDSPTGGQTASLSWPGGMAAGVVGAVIGEAKRVLT